MREILFRGKKENDGKWIYGAFIPDLAEALKYKYPYPLGIGFIKPIEADENGKRYMQAVERETVGQFTGLLDVNGKKIFEGDIVEYNGTRHEVVFEQRNGTAYFGIVIDAMETRGFCNEVPSAYMKIVGNSFDNPGLVGAEA